MGGQIVFAPRVLIATVAGSRARPVDDLTRSIVDEVHAANFAFVRSVVVKGETQFIQQLVSQVSNGNEADAMLILGGTGIGPRDSTCEAIDSLVERRIEGFGEAFRRMLREEFDAPHRALFSRATAGVYNRCLVFALAGHLPEIQRAIRTLIAPSLVEAVGLATGRGSSWDPPSLASNPSLRPHRP
jgi:molybdenum cofactor biosynthesis protein B